MAASIALPTHNNNVNNSREKCNDSELSISVQMEAAANNASSVSSSMESSDTQQPIITISGSFTDGTNSVSVRVFDKHIHGL